MVNIAGERIKTLRERNNWSLRDLETRMNIDYTVLSRIESGGRTVTDSELLQFAELFGVSTDYLVGNNSSYKNEYSKTKSELDFNDPDLQIAVKDLTDFSEEKLRQVVEFIGLLKEKERAKGRFVKDQGNK
ncbi:helix-turn-helix transcriptional regulator [Bacillus mexicanus]|uniref:helix-turn-helix domain-containing protein n=1 Tax=Bacillus mexicanus TaxID=2834415 RepID=UPI003D1E2795